VDLDGNVWVGNRNNNTLTKVGLKEAGNCIDRNGNGRIDSSTGSNDVRAWTWTGRYGDVSGAEDECILLQVQLSYAGADTPGDVRAVTVDKNNFVFAAGLGSRGIYKIRNNDGVIVAAMNSPAGHYGALVDGNNNVWTMDGGSGHVAKHNNTLTAAWRYWIGVGGYGIAVDRFNRIWSSEYGTRFSRINNDGSGLVVWNRPRCCAQGLAVTKNDEVWISGSLSSNFADRYDFNGNRLRSYALPGNPTGVAIDAAGKIWTSNYTSGNASRIDPATHQIQTLTFGLSAPYNYSDMTGYVARTFTARVGTWTVRQYCGATCNYWQAITWYVKALPPGTTVSIRARAASNVLAMANAPWRNVDNPVRLADGSLRQTFPNNDAANGLKGRVIEVEVRLTTQEDGVTPLFDWMDVDPWPL
jgi:streptogramin lyase